MNKQKNIRNMIDHDILYMFDWTFFGDSSEQNRSWEDSGMTISGIQGTHQNSIGVRMPVLIVVPRVNSKLGPF